MLSCLRPRRDGVIPVFLAMLLIVPPTRAAVGLDPAFQTELEATARVIDAAPYGSGTFLIAGDFHRIGGVQHHHVALLDTHGVPVPGFRAALDGDATVFSVAVQADGRVLVSGAFPRVAHCEQGGVIRLMPDGRLDASFHFQGAVQDGFRAGRVVLDPLGRIHLASYMDNRVEVLRLESDGRVEGDRTFRADCYLRFVGDIRPPRLHVLADGRFYLTGDFDQVWTYAGQIPRFGQILRLRPDGTPDPTFDIFLGFRAGGWPNDVWVHASIVLPDGRLVVGGQFTDFNGHARPGILAVNPDGSLDLNFRPRDIDWAHVETLMPMPDGAILAGGLFRVTGEPTPRKLVRFLADGSLDKGFGDIETRRDFVQSVLAVVPVSGDRIGVAGQGIGPGEAGPGAVALLESHGQPTGDVPPIAVTPGYAGFITPAPDGSVYIAGNFQWVNGVPSRSLVRLRHDGSMDPAFRAASASGYSGPMALLPDGTILVRGFEGAGLALLEKLDSAGDRVAGFSVAGLSGSLMGILPREDGDILVWGHFDGSPPWQADPIPPVAGPLALLTRDGTRRTNAIPVYGDVYGVTALVALPDGGFLTDGGNNGLSRFFRDFTRDTMWSVHTPDVSGSLIAGGVQTMVRDSQNRVVVGGLFGSVMAQITPGLARVALDGTLDLSFAPRVLGGSVRDMRVGVNDRLTILGTFRVGASPEQSVSVIRLLSDGSLDPDFPILGSPIISMGQDGDDLYLSVIDRETSGEPSGRVVRYNSRPTAPTVRWSWATGTRELRLDAGSPDGTIRWEMSRDLEFWTPVPGSAGGATLLEQVSLDDPPLFFRAVR